MFNQALLAKQVWRLLRNLGSLGARVLESKYYPTKSILDGVLGSSPSFVWCSFFKGKETFLKGSCLED